MIKKNFPEQMVKSVYELNIMACHGPVQVMLRVKQQENYSMNATKDYEHGS